MLRSKTIYHLSAERAAIPHSFEPSSTLFGHWYEPSAAVLKCDYCGRFATSDLPGRQCDGCGAPVGLPREVTRPRRWYPEADHRGAR